MQILYFTTRRIETNRARNRQASKQILRIQLKANVGLQGGCYTAHVSALETSVTTSGSIYLDEYIIGLENSNYYKKINDLLPIQNSEIHLKFKS